MRQPNDFPDTSECNEFLKVSYNLGDEKKATIIDIFEKEPINENDNEDQRIHL